ncbi:WecB/TagA/CpsF family glycosyltransferase [Pseudosulfitobacter sp. DSM 107133]|uniref:WecB/TagA/CpsF family glycosyltransferase n=1 Tax=Pseudosulfitobacter sp. DSM 107133 TaxID=2883100 RepID=UPI000DF2944B|nr:WecB/TagA/CpsF family glycosyltransferase [Pseudosulfitobacter sp. DSM 107133]UOA26818.1 UDP-N-acetyl-D-mannosaminuronic acid transferase [Pseudosulfitobacter sp. DSM 107133]
MFLITENGRKVAISHARRDALLRDVRAHLDTMTGFRLATVNLDHLVQIASNNVFADAYAQHDIVVADGRPIRWMSQLAGQPVEVITGSDLIVPLSRQAAQAGRSIAMIGSSDAALSGAEAHLRAHVPDLTVAYRHAPAMGFDVDSDAAGDILRDLEASGAGLCFLAFGAPKQERLAARAALLAPSVGMVSIGAGLDFLAGHQTRAPRILRILALEWLWRAATSPARMVPRYAKCFAILPGLMWRAWRAR